MYSGSIMGLALSPHMVANLQWPSVFYVFGFIGIFWFLAWEKNASSSPAVDDKISKEEKEYITSQTITQVCISASYTHFTHTSCFLHTFQTHFFSNILDSYPGSTSWRHIMSCHMGTCALATPWKSQSDTAVVCSLALMPPSCCKTHVLRLHVCCWMPMLKAPKHPCMIHVIR